MALLLRERTWAPLWRRVSSVAVSGFGFMRPLVGQTGDGDSGS